MSESKAHEMAKKQRDISIAEFFEKNRHLLGFDNKRKALLTTIKEAVDNSLDACEEARILPEITIEVLELSEDRFRITVEDNGPGILKTQVPKTFAKLLYGSKFHKLSQTRGQQGIGISAAVLYAQLTTGRPARITSRISPTEPAHYYELHIDTQKNKPEIVKESTVEWNKERGTMVEMDMEAAYLKGVQSIDEYIKETAIINPHATIIYTNPKAEQFVFSRVSEELPPHPVEIKPHPYGVELGFMIRMLMNTESRTLQAFLTSEFSRVGAGTAKDICENSSLLPTTKPKSISRQQAEQLMAGIKNTKLIAPPTNCISPIGEAAVEKGLKKEINAEFYCSSTRPPAVYRGNPFVIEAGIAYGGTLPGDKSAGVLRFANRVPLLYQQGACAISEAICKTNWRQYGLQQSSRSVPIGPIVVLVHMASVWVPFTSEAKEALAHYPEIMKEIRLALQECGRKLSMYINKKKRVSDELKKRSYIETYIPHISEALKELVGAKDFDKAKVDKLLKELLEQHRGEVADMKFDPAKNKEFDEELARDVKGKQDDKSTEGDKGKSK
ncbi:MAG: DNA topoisomerase VI subunit B [bacterium]|nr:DNA topoisomerase VI subunit B [bacterium]